MKNPNIVIISTPRSGVNWVRYCIEWFSRIKTPGYRRPIPEELLISDNHIIDRTHDALYSPDDIPKTLFIKIFNQDGSSKYKKAIILIRNYKELYARDIAYGDRILKKLCFTQTFETGTLLYSRLEHMQRYVNNINGYHQFSGEKIHIYYEDLISDFSQMLKILDFIGINYDLSDFDLEEHRLKSIKAYNRNRPARWEKAQTAKDHLNFTFHSDKRLGLKQKKSLDDYYQDKLPILYNEYLSRYKEENLK